MTQDCYVIDKIKLDTTEKMNDMKSELNTIIVDIQSYMQTELGQLKLTMQHVNTKLNGIEALILEFQNTNREFLILKTQFVDFKSHVHEIQVKNAEIVSKMQTKVNQLVLKMATVSSGIATITTFLLKYLFQ